MLTFRQDLFYSFTYVSEHIHLLNKIGNTLTMKFFIQIFPQKYIMSIFLHHKEWPQLSSKHGPWNPIKSGPPQAKGQCNFQKGNKDIGA